LKFRERRSASRKSGVRSVANYERKKTVDGLSLRLYRGEGAALLAFDLERARLPMISSDSVWK